MFAWQRLCGPFRTTRQLAELVADVKHGMDDRGLHPAMLTFQALRIFLNREMEQLVEVLDGAIQRVKVGGRVVVISFKSQEADLVREFVRRHEAVNGVVASAVAGNHSRLVELFPLLQRQCPYCVRLICDEIRPTAAEVAINSRSRSARAHILVKESRDFSRSPYLPNKGACTAEQTLAPVKPPPLRPCSR